MCGRLNNSLPPKMPTSYSPKPVHMLLYKEKELRWSEFQRILMWGDFPVFLYGSNVITRVPYKREVKRSRCILGDVLTEIRGCSDVRKRTWTKKCRWTLELKTAGNRFLPRTSRRSVACWHLDVSPVNLIWDFWPPPLWTRNMGHLKPLSVW